MKILIEKYLNFRPKPERKFDQFLATSETLIKRVNLILKFNKNKILFLGDDDFTSIACALTKQFEKIVVLDIDERILETISKISQKENLKIETVKYDLREQLLNDLENFDLIFFDPPYTPKAVELWLIRALEISLGKGSNKKRKDINFLKNKFYLMCYGYTDKAFERGLKIQKIITDFGLIIQEKFRKFNKYTGAESIQNESDLYILQPTEKIDLKLIDSFRKKEFKEKIYTWEQNSK